ncbi:MAG: hypothetical protein ABR563_13315 [Pyrinomonadaceae bacterium]
MSKLLLICLLLWQTPAPALKRVNWRSVETTDFRWRKGGETYTSVVESDVQGKEETELLIRVPSGRDFWLSIPGGVVKASDGWLDKKLAAENLLKSNYLFLTNRLKNGEGTPMLIVFGAAKASAPGSLRVLSLDKTGYPVEVLSDDNFQLTSLADLDGDGIAEIVGKHCLSQLSGAGVSTYDPYSVYRVSRVGKAAYSLTLSRSYNLRHYYGWAGRDCREDVLVALHPRKGKPRIVSAKEAERLSRK